MNFLEEEELTNIIIEYNNRTDELFHINRPRTINDSIQNCNLTLLLWFTRNGHSDLVERCIQIGSDLEHSDSYGRTALCWAILLNDVDTAEILLKGGADPNVKVKDHLLEIPIVFFMVNVCNRYEERLYLLLKYGALIHEINNFQGVFLPCTLDCFRKLLAKRRWVIFKAFIKFLAVHKRAVITANHPERLEQLGYFKEL